MIKYYKISNYRPLIKLENDEYYEFWDQSIIYDYNDNICYSFKWRKIKAKYFVSLHKTETTLDEHIEEIKNDTAQDLFTQSLYHALIKERIYREILSVDSTEGNDSTGGIYSTGEICD